jgi:hypothetical protein
VDLKEAKQKYNKHKGRAKWRNIPFLFTFEEWCHMWEQSGKWELRGRTKGKYNMSRKGDIGPYSVDNVYINLHEDNAKEGNLGRWIGRKHKEETKIKLSKPKSEQTKANMRKPNVNCPHCDIAGQYNAMQRWHFDKCKRKAA